MNPTVYIVLLAIFAVVFLLMFIKQRKPFQLILAIWMVMVILSNIIYNETLTIINGIIQIALFITTILLIRSERKKAYAKLEEMQNSQLPDEDLDD